VSVRCAPHDSTKPARTCETMLSPGSQFVELAELHARPCNSTGMTPRVESPTLLTGAESATAAAHIS
jgi:hypothetical protein